MDVTGARRRLRQFAEQVLVEVNGRTCVADYLSKHPLDKPIYMIAVGKAAVAMAAAVFDQCGHAVADGIVITKYGHGLGRNRQWPVEYMEAGHPIPDDNSLRAGAAVIRALQAWPPDAGVLVLLSGGASALMESLPAHADLELLRRANRWLLSSGLPIDAMNAVRKGLSRVKGGGLLAYGPHRRIIQLLISDVPGNRLDIIGSGPFIQNVHYRLPAGLPTWLAAVIESPAVLNSTVSPQSTVVADNAQACHAARQLAAAAGLPVVGGGRLYGNVNAMAERIVAGRQPGFSVWGGETTVRLSSHTGIGGRNQHLALLIARRLAGQPFVCLCLASDGDDGESTAAGALVDGQTIERGQQKALSVQQALAAFDAGTYLRACGDVLTTGPTGTNVMDLVMLLRG